MPLFCSVCRNLMTIATTANAFHYQCGKCMTFEAPSDRDTLVHEDVSGTNLTIYKAILYNAGKDPVNPKVRRACKCGNQFARQVRLGNEMKLINTCTACGEQWLDGTRDSDLYTQDSQEPSEPQKIQGSKDVDDIDDAAVEESRIAENPKEDKKENSDIEYLDDSSETDIEKSTKSSTPVSSKTYLTLTPAEPNNKNAIVWFLFGGDRYVPGIITSIYSVKRFNPKADLVVMVTDDVPQSARDTLMKYATHLFSVPFLRFPGKFRMQKKMTAKYGSWIDMSFTKWNVLALPYEKAFLLDADVIARKDLSSIFDMPTPSAVIAKPMSAATSAGMPFDYSVEGSKVNTKTAKWILSQRDAFGAAASSILLAPNSTDYQAFITAMKDFKPLSLKNETGADEQSITYFYSMVKKIDWNVLGPKWNTVPWFEKYADADPLIVHFMSKEKPWEMNKDEWPDVAEWHDMYDLAKSSISSVSS